MSQPYRKFMFLVDTHWGYERRSGHKVPLHDERAIDVTLQFAGDFKPDVVVLGGDILDCNAISHHERNKPGEKEGLRLIEDAEECAARIIAPIIKLGASEYSYIIGNHCAWLEDMEGEVPGLTGMLNVRRLMSLPKSWNVIPQGGDVSLGKLTFIHGDTVTGGEHVAKSAVVTYERNIRFGHHHTCQIYTKTSPLSNKLGKTGVAVPCLCKKDPKYGKGRPNRWVQGFNYGYILPDGTFNDYVTLIAGGRAVINGKVYKG